MLHKCHTGHENVLLGVVGHTVLAASRASQPVSPPQSRCAPAFLCPFLTSLCCPVQMASNQFRTNVFTIVAFTACFSEDHPRARKIHSCSKASPRQTSHSRVWMLGVIWPTYARDAPARLPTVQIHFRFTFCDIRPSPFACHHLQGLTPLR